MRQRIISICIVVILVFNIYDCARTTEDRFVVEPEIVEPEITETEEEMLLPESVDDQVETDTESSEAMDEELDIVSSGWYKKQERISNISNGQCSYEIIGEDECEITLYNKEHEKVYSEVYPFREPEPWVEAISDDILAINISFGSNARYTFYFDTETAEISDTYFNAKVFGDKYIAYMDSDVIGTDEITLTLTDIFEKGILYQEVVRDFTACADPMSAIMSVELIDDTNIRLEYLAGTDYTHVTETIELEWTSVFCGEPITVVSKETEYSSDGNIKYWYEYEYSGTGNLTKEIHYNADGSLWRWYEYEYDNVGNQIKQTQYYDDGSVGWRYEYEYDSVGNEVKNISYDADGSIWCWYEYKYDGAGNQTKEIYYNAAGGINWWWENEYDSAGNQLKYICHDAMDNIKYWYEYEYDSTGSRERYTLYNADGSVKYWFEYKYDSAGNEVKNIEYSPSGSLLYWYEYEYDSEGNRVKFTEYHADDSTDHWHEYEYITIIPQ